MSKNTSEQYVVGLDVGSSKIAVVIGRSDMPGKYEVVGASRVPSNGIQNGAIINIESVAQDIRRAIEEAELMSGCRVHSVHCGISGNHSVSKDSDGVIALHQGLVSEADIMKVLEAARAVPIENDQILLHALPQEYKVDHQVGVVNPLGMSGSRLEAMVHLIAVNRNSVMNTQHCVSRSELETNRLILDQIASAEAVLTSDEKQLGCCLINIGAGTTSLILYHGGAIRHTACLPLGGDNITNDLSMALRTTVAVANKVKITHGCALTQLADADTNIEIKGVLGNSTQEISELAISEIIEPLYDELLSKIRDEIRRSGMEDLIGAGLILTGGGAKIKGLLDLTEDVFHMPSRIGVPVDLGGTASEVYDPEYSTAVGLMRYACRDMDNAESANSPTEDKPLPPKPLGDDDAAPSLTSMPTNGKTTSEAAREESIGVGVKRWISENF